METVNQTNPPRDSPPYQQPGHRLTRATDDKVVAGVAGGLGRYFGIDPVVFRIAFVVLTLAGGSGVLLYLLAWLMVPDDRGATVVLLRSGKERNQKLVAAVLAGIGVMLLLDNFSGDHDGVPLGMALVGGGALLLWSRRRQNTDGGPPAFPSPPAAPTPPLPPSPPTSPAGDGPTGDGPTADGPTGDGEAATASSAATGSVPAPPALPPPPLPPPATARHEARPAKPPSALLGVTLSLLVLLAGGLSLAGVSPRTGLACALLLTGAALVVGGWRGRARWLIPVGLVLSMALATAAVIDVPLRGGAGRAGFHPVALEEIRSPYRQTAGELILDLGDLDLRGETTTIVASVAAGHLLVSVPAGAGLEVDAHAGAGNVVLLGRQWDGLDIARRLDEPGREGAGRVVLRARVGVGEVEVQRAQA